MSECVVRMEMPESCKKCKATLCLWTIDDCEIVDTIAAVQNFRKENDDGFPDFCPIIFSLPEWHGRLVDADALKDYLIAEAASYDLTQGQMGILSEAIDMIDEQPTIVPATAERSET